MRYLGAVRGTARFASEDIVYRDVLFPQGTLVSTSLAGANRDPEAFEDPDVFDITRERDDRPDDLRCRHPLLHGRRAGPGGAPRGPAAPGPAHARPDTGRRHRMEALDLRDLGTGPAPAPLRPGRPDRTRSSPLPEIAAVYAPRKFDRPCRGSARRSCIGQLGDFVRLYRAGGARYTGHKAPRVHEHEQKQLVRTRDRACGTADIGWRRLRKGRRRLPDQLVLALAVGQRDRQVDQLLAVLLALAGDHDLRRQDLVGPGLAGEADLVARAGSPRRRSRSAQSPAGPWRTCRGRTRSAGRPPAPATSSWCIGLKSPEAPAYLTRSVRVSVCEITGASSPTFTSSKDSFFSPIVSTSRRHVRSPTTMQILHRSGLTPRTGAASGRSTTCSRRASRGPPPRPGSS